MKTIETTAVYETKPNLKSPIKGLQGFIFLPACTSDGQKGFDEQTGLANTQGPAYAGLAVDHGLAKSLEISARICSQGTAQNECVYIRAQPDCWGGSLEMEAIKCNRLYLQNNECWFVGHTQAMVEVRTFRYPINQMVAALKGQTTINFFGR